MFRSLWLMAAFGGPRISEQLNFWQADVLPPSSYPDLFGGTQPFTQPVLVVRAHPEHSTYCGVLGDLRETRKVHLMRLYGRRPRSSLPTKDPDYAGWKGTLATGAGLTHPVFWIDQKAAGEYSALAEEIRVCNDNSEVRPASTTMSGEALGVSGRGSSRRGVWRC
jgi:hypothetical protein